MEYGDFHDRKVEDFDFACSPTWRAYYNEQYGYPSQRDYPEYRQHRVDARLNSLEASNTLPVNHAHKLEQTQTALRDLQKKLSNHLKKGVGRGKYD